MGKLSESGREKTEKQLQTLKDHVFYVNEECQFVQFWFSFKINKQNVASHSLGPQSHAKLNFKFQCTIFSDTIQFPYLSDYSRCGCFKFEFKEECALNFCSMKFENDNAIFSSSSAVYKHDTLNFIDYFLNQIKKIVQTYFPCCCARIISIILLENPRKPFSN